MKCIQCNADNNLKDRTANQGRCKNCNHPFAFEPTTMDVKIRFTDGFFAKALADISANDTLYFTPKQLLYLLEKRLARKAALTARSAKIGGGAVLIFVGFVTAVFGIGLVVIAIGLWLLISGLRSSARRPQLRGLTITETMVNTWLQQWQRINGSSTRLLSAPSAAQPLAPAAEDVTAYSFDRVLVCDSGAIAQLLIANNIHFEHNCAVLSITGYPQTIFATTMAMLRRNPDLQVLALHNCSPRGVALMHELRTSPDWFAENTPMIVDLGLLPRQIEAARQQSYIQTSTDSAQAATTMSAEVRQSLSEAELQWLEAGYFVELESFTPQKLIQIVSRGIARLQNLGAADDDNLILMGDTGDRSGTLIYTSDNFG
ncbi:hypothetical protein [Nodosilinea sp. E11]|uniref:hypothetical protein n=1 Tax=Nodosilinea sp. E11 TaxID=3037479 RepID=UPI0029347D31|nr:hypothetical protein [Nodosilinea sp. E11]WOD39813.1 hypothetical protein RRF56_03275 [Nodosilinea sp. E11]